MFELIYRNTRVLECYLNRPGLDFWLESQLTLACHVASSQRTSYFCTANSGHLQFTLMVAGRHWSSQSVFEAFCYELMRIVTPQTNSTSHISSTLETFERLKLCLWQVFIPFNTSYPPCDQSWTSREWGFEFPRADLKWRTYQEDYSLSRWVG